MAPLHFPRAGAHPAGMQDDADGARIVPGRPVRLGPDLVRVTCDNPSPLTGPGTNTYLLGRGDARIVVDPGPDGAPAAAHLDAVLAAAGGARIAAILVTHAHLDHSAAAPLLAVRTGAPVLGFGPPEAGRSARMARLAGGLEGGEGLDRGFTPHRTLADGEVLRAAGVEVRAIHTPGHFGGHLAFALGDAVLSGDLAMAWATTLVSPPDGDVADFARSCARLAALAPAVLHPGHGGPVADPPARLAALVAHRRAREAQIRAALAAAPGTPAALAARIYADVPPALLPAAARNVLAHLIDLEDRGLAAADGPPGPAATFAARGGPGP